jgi:predicted RNA-binding protein with RPS1 domain
VNASSKSLFEHQTHVNQLSDMIEDQTDGPAKNELVKVLKNANEHVKDLEEHVSVGKKLIDVKYKSLIELQKKLSLPVQQPFQLAQYKVEPKAPHKKKVTEVLKPKVIKVEPVVKKENVTASLISQLRT